MIDSDLGESGLFDFGNQGAVADEVFARHAPYQLSPGDLRAVAYDLFYGRKKRASDLECEVKELLELAEVIACVIGKTYVERGDSFNLADDEALTLIRDLLLRYNPRIVARNKNKRLAKHLL